MKLLDRLSGRFSGRPSSSSRASADNINATPASDDIPSSPPPIHAPVPYGFSWCPTALPPAATWMLSIKTEAANERVREVASRNILDKMWDRRNIGDTNFRIKCGDQWWDVHKEVLAANSEYFDEIFRAPQPPGTYLTMIELQPCNDDDDIGRPDRYEPEYIGEVIHFFYKFSFTQDVKEMAPIDRLCFIAKVHRTASQFHATEAARAMLRVFGDCLPRFNDNEQNRQQVGGPTLADFAQVCGWILAHPDPPGLVWELKLYLIDYVREHLTCMTSSAEMCAMLRDTIYPQLGDRGAVLPSQLSDQVMGGE